MYLVIRTFCLFQMQCKYVLKSRHLSGSHLVPLCWCMWGLQQIHAVRITDFGSFEEAFTLWYWYMKFTSHTGHGKLLLGKDGYYEGTFKDGEIEGHGYKVFGISKATYTGQFHLGEMHGQGLMRKPNGEQYEGCWHKGKRQGEYWRHSAESGCSKGKSTRF